ncbi:hypothetical protein ABI_11740 [Asticcacaulis biprosthecium C19]|uniref:Uncharacterized protein n=1 Tax=Asticcacaulis biprosthecium C19 TaxID=715226 RepID=F4QHK1_9CAUL|nr:hypothetical protein ABI_11740 [Asticcacaulis biprosthecium C19]
MKHQLRPSEADNLGGRMVRFFRHAAHGVTPERRIKRGAAQQRCYPIQIGQCDRSRSKYPFCDAPM